MRWATDYGEMTGFGVHGELGWTRAPARIVLLTGVDLLADRHAWRLELNARRSYSERMVDGSDLRPEQAIRQARPVDGEETRR